MVMVLAGGHPSGESGMRGDAKASWAVAKTTNVAQPDTYFMHVPQTTDDGLETPNRDAAALAVKPAGARHNLERCRNWGNYKAVLCRAARTLSWLRHEACGTPSQKRDNPSAMMELQISAVFLMIRFAAGKRH